MNRLHFLFLFIYAAIHYYFAIFLRCFVAFFEIHRTDVEHNNM